MFRLLELSRGLLTHQLNVFVPVRGAKRKGVKLLRLQKEGKMIGRKKVKNEVEKPKIPFAQRMLELRAKTTVSVSMQYPPRQLNPPKSLPPADDDVWQWGHYKEVVYTVEEAVTMHREAMHPTLYNRPNAILRLRMELNLTTDKRNKMMPESNQVVLLPNPINITQKRLIMALAKDVELQTKAVQAGAEMVGGPEVIKQILKGKLQVDDVDFFVCHTDMVYDITPLRGILKARYPSPKNGCIGEDVEDLVDRFKNGLSFRIEQDLKTPQWGMVDTVFATLDMSIPQIETNLASILKIVCDQRTGVKSPDPLINRALLMVKPGTEYFAIDLRRWVSEELLRTEFDDKEELQAKKVAN